jgi:transcriptional regulator with XRE-family HTH domain
MSGFGALLRQFREREGWGLQALATRAGFDSAQVSRLEAGARRPTRAEHVQAFADALNLGAFDAGRLLVAAGYIPTAGVAVIVNGELIALTAHERPAPKQYQPRPAVCEVCRDYSKPVRARGRCGPCYERWRYSRRRQGVVLVEAAV